MDGEYYIAPSPRITAVDILVRKSILRSRTMKIGSVPNVQSITALSAPCA